MKRDPSDDVTINIHTAPAPPRWSCASDVSSVEISIKLSMRPLHAHWLIGLYYFMSNTPEMIEKILSWSGSEKEDLFQELD